MANKVIKGSSNPKPLGGGPAPQTKQPLYPKSGSTVVDASQAVVGNTGGGSTQTRCMKDRPGSCSDKKG